MNVAAGRYRLPVILFRYTHTRDARTRETTLTPLWAGRTRAQILPVSPARVEAARQLFEGAAVEFRIRRNPSLEPEVGWAVWHRGLAYEIGAVVNERMADVEIRLVCGAGRPLEEPTAP